MRISASDVNFANSANSGTYMEAMTMSEKEIASLMEGIANNNKVFINETHFQYEFAIAINKAMKGLGYTFTLEYYPHFMKYRIDLFIKNTIGYTAAVEFKYITKKYAADIDGLKINLKAQRAQNVRRYASWRDIEKIEQLKKNKLISEGFFILVTNDSEMINDVPINNIDSPFDISQGNHPQSNDLYWNNPDSHPKTTKRYPNKIHIDGKFYFDYKKYRNGEFSYVIVKI